MHRKLHAFSLLELLVSMAVLVILLLILMSIVDFITKSTTSATAQVGQYRESRRAFDTIARRISQATLATYGDAFSRAQWSGVPITRFVTGQYQIADRTSELRFVSSNIKALMASNPTENSWPLRFTHSVFFQAPLGFSQTSSNNTTVDITLNDLRLNTWGYFIEYGDEDETSFPRPSILQNTGTIGRSRYRLMELMEPCEELTIYKYTSGWKTWPREDAGRSYNGITNSESYYTKNGLLTYGTLLQFGQTRTENYGAGKGGAMEPNLTGLEWLHVPITTREYGNSNGKSTPLRYRVLAENIIALVLLPQLSVQDETSLSVIAAGTRTAGTYLAPNYTYDSSSMVANAQLQLATAAGAAWRKINPRHQLPPIIRITMVAIDEKSASRLAKEEQTNNALQRMLRDDLFQVNRNNNAMDYSTDMRTLENFLKSKNINYRVFTTSVNINAAKWTRDQ